jgi:hypothetical protein
MADLFDGPESGPDGLWHSPAVAQNTPMNANEAVVPSPYAAPRVIVYEQPLN